MLTFEGERVLPQPPQAVFAKLRDASFLAECIPDATVQGQPQRDQVKLSVRPGLSFIGGSLTVNLTIVEAVEPSRLRFQAVSKGIGTSSDVSTAVTLEPADAGTHIRYQAEVTKLGGLLKAVPSGLIRGAAQKIIEQVWTRLEEKLK